jgi:DMSO/TMAO reductase YedYZ molybdopterin-dependent catalytic subunit
MTSKPSPRNEAVSRRQFLVTTGSASVAVLAGSPLALAQAPAAKFHVKPLPREIFIDHGINQETRLETLRGLITPASHFFVRNHTNTPLLDLSSWRLRVEGNALDRTLD